MKKLFAKKDSATMIAEIHETFYNAGDKLLAEAMQLIDSKSLPSQSKVNRLSSIGFTNSIEVKRWDDVKLTKEVADLVTYYKAKYPLNKFITEGQVSKICAKYNLVCAPVKRFKGFVPNEKLKQIEQFNLKKEDSCPDLIRITSAWATGIFLDFPIGIIGAVNIHRKLNMRLIPENDESLNWHSTGKLFSVSGLGDTCYVERYKRYSKSELLICAPKKDMDLKGLSKIGSIFTSMTTVTVPDPVVLQPVKGGYLILAAWGEEASDEIVVNPIEN